MTGKQLKSARRSKRHIRNIWWQNTTELVNFNLRIRPLFLLCFTCLCNLVARGENQNKFMLHFNFSIFKLLI